MKPLLTRFTEEQLKWLKKKAHKESKEKGRFISRAEIIRFCVVWIMQMESKVK